MTTPDPGSAVSAFVNADGTVGASLEEPLSRPDQPTVYPKSKNENIRVSSAVLDAARENGEQLLRDLRTTSEGLTQQEAEKRGRTMGPNEVAQEKPQGWPVRLLKIIRNALVILLVTLSAVSFATGDARAGTVMVMMVALSVGLRFWQEARADAAAAKLKAMIHVTATAFGTARQERSAPGFSPRRHHSTVCRRHDSGNVRVLSSKDLLVSQGSLTGESLPVEKLHDPEAKSGNLAH